MNKEEFIEQALKANNKALEGKGLSDLTDKASSVYKTDIPQRERTIRPENTGIDAEGLPEIPTLKTFTGDLGNAIKNKNVSMLNIAVSNQSVTRNVDDEVVKKIKTKKIIWGVGAGILFLLGLASLYFAYGVKRVSEEPVRGPVAPREIIYSEARIAIDITENSRRLFGEELKQELTKIRAKDTIEEIVPIIKVEGGPERVATRREFFDAVEISPPGTFDRFLSDRYYFGVWSDGAKNTPFLLLSSSSGPETFSGMLEWESTLPQEGIAIFENTYPKDVLSLSFKDRVIQNQDTRILESPEGTVFFYTILNRNVILLTSSEGALKKVIERLRESQLR